ncbi:hypothetical protein CNMCM5793_007664 [Aspergillus hiratsukae]|uniref:DUF3752 domain-containing protein n=1 Tax=Aspergillus hiratsukae TaxID=1194566 RepID=A0A8H6QKD1_9EURO|nr:hypothetical protein CNMCM5793_007664 [Aspergillus hiratsukae]KAF7174399.1 hypothetical protein CNMCM6106_008664 [Aspergillus hiratsukae]
MDNNTKRKPNGSGSDNEHETVLKRRKVFGPVLPSSYFPHGPRNQQGVENTGTEGLSREDEGEDEDGDGDAAADDADDDDYGPCLPPLGGEVITNPNEVKIGNEPRTQSGKPDAQSNNSQRDSWMLRPPKPSDLSSRLDPTRLKNRKFQGGQSLSHSGEEVDITWTETPQQKLKRLQDEAMGVSPQSVHNHDRSSTSRPSRSTLRQHDSTEASERASPSTTKLLRSAFNDDPSRRPFEWEKDMASAPKVSTLQHQKQVGEAVDFASKFTKGKYL